MLDRNIAKAVLEMAMFLEFADETVLDPDAAVAAMEQLAANLQNAEPTARTELRELFSSMIGEYSGQEDFVSAAADALGLV